MKKTIGICGDSFFAATQNTSHESCQDAEGKHFSEILAQRLGYNMFTLARGACSNSAIRLQVSEMVKRKVDFIIVGTTSENRIEYPMRDSNNRFDKSKGIYNLHYTGSPDASALHFDPKDETLYSDTLNNIFGSKINTGLVRNEIQRAAIQHYFMQMFDFSYKAQQDAWITASGIQEIRASGIPYLLLSEHQPTTEYFADHTQLACEVFGNKQPHLLPHSAPCALVGQRRWHTSDEFQAEYADTLYDYITKHQLLG